MTTSYVSLPTTYHTINSSLTISYQPIPLKDKSTAKDILKLCLPYDATDNIAVLFSNQAVPLNKAILANKETDTATDTVCDLHPKSLYIITFSLSQFPLATFECIDPGSQDSDLLYTVQLGKKFAVNIIKHETKLQTELKPQTPPPTYIPDTSQRLMKKRALALQQSKGIEPAKDDGKDPTKNVKCKHHNPTMMNMILTLRQRNHK